MLLHRLQMFVTTLMCTVRTAREGLARCAIREGISRGRLLVSYGWHTLTDLLRILAYQNLLGLRRGGSGERGVVVVLPGYLMSARGMPDVLGALIAEGFRVEPVHGVLTLGARKRMRREALAILERGLAGPHVLLGYSFGGSLAHALGEELGIPSVSLSTPLSSKGAPFGAIMSLFGIDNYKDPIIPPHGLNFVEAFSETIPDGARCAEGRTRVIPGIHSHFAVNHPKVVATLTAAVREAAAFANPAPAEQDDRRAA